MSARAATIGIGYHFWLRSRWVLLGALAVTVAQVAAVHFLSWADLRNFVIFVGMFPIGLAVVYLVGIFTFSGDMSTPESGYPRHMLVLPVANRALAMIPMLYAAVCIAALWLTVAQLVLAPMGWRLPNFLPVIEMVSIVAWLQAVSWMPFWFPFARVAASVGSVCPIIAFAIGAQFLGFGEGVITGVLMAATALAVLAAVGGLARARRGDGTAAPWAGRRAAVREIVPKRRPFASAQRAQIWLELRRNCTMLIFFPLLAALLAFVPPLLRATPQPLAVQGMIVEGPFILIVGCLVTPVIFSGMIGAELGKADAWAKTVESPSFLATRPLDDNSLVWAKMKASALAIVTIWAVLLAIVAAGWMLPYTYSQSESLVHFLLRHATPHGALVAAAAIVGLVLISWINVAKSFALVLYGRRWLNTLAPFVVILGFSVILTPFQWALRHPAALPLVLQGFRIAIWVLIAMKISAAALIIGGIRRCRVSTNEQLIAWTAAWFLAAATIFAVVLWLVPPAQNAQLVVIAVVVLAVPYNRLIAMPLAWHHNRHR